MKKLFIKFLALLGLLWIANVIHERFFLENDLRKYAPLALKINRMEPFPDVLYIGESSNSTFRGDDANKSSIAVFIGEHLKEARVAEITQPAGHAGTFKDVLNYAVQRLKPKIVIVTLNLRSFDATWVHSRLEPSLSESLVLMRDYPAIVNRTMLSFKDYFTQSQRDADAFVEEMWSQPFKNLPPDFPYSSASDWQSQLWRDSTKFLNKEEQILAQHYVKSYAFEIDTLSHPRIEDLDDIVQMANQAGFKLCFNIMAENCDKARELVGEDLIYLMERNRDILLERYRKKGVLVVDNLTVVPDAEFIDRDWTTEHYAENGRRLIAVSVSKQLSDSFKLEFTEGYLEHDPSTTKFSNDCEGSIVWVGGDSVSDEDAYSGTYSSKTGVNLPYSLTFEFPIHLLPLNQIENVHYSFVYKGERPDLSKAVLQTTGDNPFFASAPFHGVDFSPQKWCQAQVIFPINDQIRSAKTIKLYVLTNSDPQLFTDDFIVEFK